MALRRERIKMNVLGILIIAAIVSAAVTGLVIGLVKGFSNSSAWGVEYALSCVLTVLICGAVKNGMNGGDEQVAAAGLVSLGIGTGFILLFSATSLLCRTIFRHSKKRKVAELGAKPTGASGAVDRLFGGFTLAVKGVAIAGVVATFVLVALDLAQWEVLNGFTGDIFDIAVYTAFKPYMLDCLYLGLLMLAVKCGFHGGISNVLWGVIVLGMVVFAGFASYNLAFNVESFQGAVSSLSGVFAGGAEVSEMNVTVAKWALTAIIFLLMCVVIVLVAIFVPKLLDFARNSKIFYAIDGVFGALFSVSLVIGLLLVLGNIVQPLAVDLERYAFMSKFTSYFESSSFATYFYDKDILSMFGVPPLLPLNEWLG